MKNHQKNNKFPKLTAQFGSQLLNLGETAFGRHQRFLVIELLWQRFEC
jgi:hypothetical protein